MIYQVIGIVVGIAGIIISLIRFREARTSPGGLLLWLILWFSMIFFSLNPASSTKIANLLGIGRGLDFLLIAGILGSYYLLFRIYLMIEALRQEITELVHEIALRDKRDD
ncbi:DUF2304 family protein [Methanothermobacter sp. THM-1]|uniref:DUF2304 domain-containing protein n=1 Tax=Methanothermobacter sp. THM-1 TaxID=2606911 RepID=UPI0013668C7C|nr:DUF2304 family protein [Methanothermobacter sp. THM-1]QHN06062.1 DUF2304 family protein [Methanothermobacter sp. THM-1]